MNDFDALLVIVSSQARAAGVPISKNIDPHISVNTRAKRRFGLCRKKGDGFTIELSSVLLSAAELSALLLSSSEELSVIFSALLLSCELSVTTAALLSTFDAEVSLPDWLLQPAASAASIRTDRHNAFLFFITQISFNILH